MIGQPGEELQPISHTLPQWIQFNWQPWTKLGKITKEKAQQFVDLLLTCFGNPVFTSCKTTHFEHWWPYWLHCHCCWLSYWLRDPANFQLLHHDLDWYLMKCITKLFATNRHCFQLEIDINKPFVEGILWRRNCHFQSNLHLLWIASTPYPENYQFYCILTNFQQRNMLQTTWNWNFGHFSDLLWRDWIKKC